MNYYNYIIDHKKFINLYKNKNDNIHKNEVQDIRRSDEY